MNFQIGLKPAGEGTRLVWNSDKVRRLWEPRLHLINTEWPKVEREAVLREFRGCTLQALKKGFAYEQVVQWANNNGLCVRPVKAVGYWEGFAHQYKDGDDLWVTAIANSLDALEEPEKYLGYPECCQAFFATYFPTVIDPIWQWAWEKESVIVSPYSNPLLRYYNIRFAPHIPCSVDCKPSIHLGLTFRSLMSSEVAEWIEELLSGPLQWDNYRGVAIVTAKYFSLIVGSNPTSERYIVRSNNVQTVQLKRA